MARRKQEERPEPCKICRKTECPSRIHWRQTHWTTEEWEGALRMTEARLAAGYEIRTKPRVRRSRASRSGSDENDVTEWDAVRVPYVKDEWDQLVLDTVAPF